MELRQDKGVGLGRNLWNSNQEDKGDFNKGCLYRFSAPAPHLW